MLFCNTQRSSTANMVLIILDVLPCDVPMNACVWTPRVSDLSEVYKSANAFGHLQFLALYWLRNGTFSGTQLSLSLSRLSSKCYCSPGNERPGVRVTSLYNLPRCTSLPHCYHQPLRNKNLRPKCKLLHLPLQGKGDPTRNLLWCKV